MVSPLDSKLLTKAILKPSQHGFRNDYFAAAAVLSVADILKSALNDDHILLEVFLDVTKSF